MIILPLKYVGDEGHFDETKLLLSDPDPEDDNYRHRLLPEISVSKYFSSKVSHPVVSIFGRRYYVILDLKDGVVDPWEVNRKTISFVTTEESETSEATRRDTIYKYFGQPRWVQGEYFPADSNGNCCYHLLTIENGWGDCGNVNILIGLDENKIPFEAFLEASCC